MELETEDETEADPEQEAAEREWADVEAAAAAGDWEAIGLDAPTPGFRPATVDDFLRAPE